MARRQSIQQVLVLILVYGLTFLPITAYSSSPALSRARHPTKTDAPETKVAEPPEAKLAPPLGAPSPEESGQARVREAYGSIPISFVANQGQTDSQVRFMTSGGSYSLFLTGTEAVMVLSKRKANRASLQNDRNDSSDELPMKNVIRMKLAGANSSPELVALNEMPWKTNYFIGNDPEKWQVGVSSYGKIKYQDVYQGVDMVYHGKGRQLEYDFVVAPHVDPSVIRINFDGAETLRINNDGDLLLNLKNGGELRQRAPVIYQEGDNGQERINGRFIIINKRDVGFDVGEYDHGKPLVIDPVLNYSTYLGGGNDDQGNSIAVDTSGNAYVTGQTSSVNFPVANALQSTYGGGASNVFVTKLNAAGTAILYSTYLGGTVVQGQGGDDRGYGIAVDASGNAYITGSTTSSNFPLANPIQSNLNGNNDAFISKLNASGSALVYSTYLGGGAGSYYNQDEGRAIAIDVNGNAYVAGSTKSNDFPIINPVQATNQGGNYNEDAFVAKLNSAGTALIYSTYLGGSGDEHANAIAVDASGYAYVTGSTVSTNFPTANGPQLNFGGGSDAFVTKLSITGTALVYSTYLGGTGYYESGNGIAADHVG